MATGFTVVAVMHDEAARGGFVTAFAAKNASKTVIFGEKSPRMPRGEVAGLEPPCLTPHTMNDSISSPHAADIGAQLQRERDFAAENRPTREEAMSAVRVLLRWAGDDPEREGLVGTPDRVVRAYEEFFAGYQENPVEILSRTFEETEGYDELVVLKDIRFESHCEHHMVPIIGKAHIAYLPDRRVVGISKLARVLEVYARRFQIQEKMTAQVATTIQAVLQPRGVAVVVDASHQCMTTRGVHRPGVSMVTSSMLGVFRDDPETRREFLTLIGK